MWHDERYSHPDVWSKILYKFLKYRDTKVVGSENFTDLRPDNIWVAGAFLDLGKNSYVVKHNNKAYMHETFAGFRKEEIPIMLKEET